MIKNIVNNFKTKIESEIKKSIYDDSERTLVKETYTVVGIDYYMQNINKLRVTNTECKKPFLKPFAKTYKYTYINKPVQLIPEPRNMHDRNAIQVLISGELVGYISREDNIHVRNILRRSEIKYISSYINGGPYKTLYSNNKVINNEDPLIIKISIGYVR